MTTLRLFSVALSASLLLTACGGIRQIDSRFPSVSQQDAFDVSWGLPARKSRGNPKMRYQYDSRADVSPPISAAPAPAAAAPAPAPIAPILPESSSQPIPASLR